MLRNRPRLTYKGLTIVLSNPSRFDTVSLLSATAGSLVNDYCLRPEMNSMQCDIRLADDFSPLVEGTKCVLLCGEHAMHKWLPETKESSIGELRGSPFIKNGIVHIPTFFPQDAADLRTYEQQLNPMSKEYQPDASEYDNDDEGDVKRHGKTARRNYAFWLRADVRKAKTVINNGGKIPTSKYPEPIYHIYPNSQVVIDSLMSTKDSFKYFDIETDYEQQNLQCFAYSFDGRNIYSVPVLDCNYKPAYSNTHRVLAALSYALNNNIVVAHNGAAFDFDVMAHKYRLPVSRCYDTMLAMHRCFPDVEKSLGHCISYFLWEKFHKDEDSHGYLNREQMDKRLRYCAKDVRTMYMLHQEIENYARTIPGLVDSIQCANDAIIPYLTTSLQGIRYDEKKVKDISQENDQLMMQYNRVINLLIGEQGMKDVRACLKGKAKMFAGSNSQCCEYFHEILGYPVVARSKKTGKPSLGKKALFKLALKHENPVIQFCLAYREVSKSYSTLQFIPWKDNENKTINYDQYIAGQNTSQSNLL